MVQKQRPVMTIHLTGSARHFDEDLVYYRKIVDVIHAHEHILALNWIEPAYVRLKRDPDERGTDWQSVLEANAEATARADLVIIEASHYGFGQGYHTALALQQKKPVLLVSRDPKIEHRLASGITDELCTLKTYKNEQDLEKIVGRFLQDNTLTSKDLRFNFFLDREIYNHLRWTSFKTGKTKAEIIRDLIEREINEASY